MGKVEENVRLRRAAQPGVIHQLRFKLALPPARIAKRNKMLLRALAVSEMDDDLIDAVTRLVRLLDRPQEAAVLAPLIRRELMWRLLTGERADMMRQIGSAGGRLDQVRKAIRWLRVHYAEPMRIERSSSGLPCNSLSCPMIASSARMD